MKRMLIIVVAFSLLACAPAEEPADLVLMGGRIITMDSANPEADALASRGQQLVAVGSFADVKKFIGPETEVIDLGGAFAVPGLIEGHGHFLQSGRAKMHARSQSRGSSMTSWPMVEAAVAEAEPGQWILGRGWHQEKWDCGHPKERLRAALSRCVERGLTR